MKLNEIISLMITMIIFKWIIAILDTPFMIITTKIKNNIDACKVMAEEIKKNYNLDEDNIELIGMARGGLPMLVTL